jgi:hypothetical protein
VSLFSSEWNVHIKNHTLPSPSMHLSCCGLILWTLSVRFCFETDFRVQDGFVGYKPIFLYDPQLRPYLPESTGSRSISAVKLVRALLVLQCESMWESQGAVVPTFGFFLHFWEGNSWKTKSDVEWTSGRCVLPVFTPFFCPWSKSGDRLWSVKPGCRSYKESHKKYLHGTQFATTIWSFPFCF